MFAMLPFLATALLCFPLTTRALKLVSSRQSQLTPNSSQSSFSFIKFEQDLFPQWEAKFQRGGVGEYAFYPAPSSNASMYGSADVAYVYFAMGRLQELPPSLREAWAKRLQNFQEESGEHWFTSRPGPADYLAQPVPEPVERWHAAAEAVEALFLLGQKPSHKLSAVDALLGKDGVEDEMLWRNFMSKYVTGSANLWRDSAVVQAPIGIATMLKENSSNFTDFYFAWLDLHSDASQGYWFDRLRHTSSRDAMAASFHMLKSYSCHQRTWKNPEALVDATLQLQLPNGLFGSEPSTCLDLDGIFISIRASEMANHYRWDSVRELCRRYLQWAVDHLNSPSVVLGSYAEHTHLLHGPLFAVAECQSAFPELAVETEKPWQRSKDACIYA